ncbi:MAG: hypothetical protein NT162_02250 [Candidatus Woesebacteria bacterium]|nr:hypothetical protein [Candidatus Woesebacteria bacterium]
MGLFVLFGGSGVLTSTDSYTEPLIENIQKVVQPSSKVIQPGQTLGQQLAIAGITTLLGFVVYVIGQVLTKFIIEPIQDQRRIIGEIADALIFYANKYRNLWGYGTLDLWESEEVKKEKKEKYLTEKEKMDKISDTIRRLGSLLIAKTHMISFYKFWSILHIVKPMKNIITAKKALIGLSNQVDTANGDDLRKYEEEIRSALGIFNPDNVS